jgi:hypothetical protein
MTNLRSIQNENGGGLSVSVTGKYTSVRHELARINGKLTAGETAKYLTKEIGSKIYAKEVVEAYKLLKGSEPEWHHAGFYKGSTGSTMGRTFFFNDDDLKFLIDNWTKIPEVEKQKIEEGFETINGFYYEWESDMNGYRGKRRNFKVLKAFEGLKRNKPKNFTSCTQEQFYKVEQLEGKEYYGWDEPKLSEFI